MVPAIRYLKDREGNTVAYTVVGEGPPLVFPCWWVSHVEKDWDSPHFRRFFSALSQRFQLVLYDRPGVGLSDREVPPRTRESEVGLLGSVIEATAPGQPVSLFAISCAAPIALTYAARHPDRVARICCYGGYLDGADIAAPELQKVIFETIRTHWGLGSRALADIFIPNQTREEFEWMSRQQRNCASAEKAAELLELTYALDATDCLDRFSTDLLVIHRQADRAIPCSAGRRLAAAIPGTPFLALKGSAHPPWFGDSDVLDLAMAYLTGASAPVAKPEAPEPVNQSCWLDARNRELVCPDRTVLLTPLEYRVARYLLDADGQLVTRDELLENVWRSPFAGSNKVDAVISTLRRKCGRYSGNIETVRGHGYRFRAP